MPLRLAMRRSANCSCFDQASTMSEPPQTNRIEISSALSMLPSGVISSPLLAFSGSPSMV
jgi:hypothetical protein